MQGSSRWTLPFRKFVRKSPASPQKGAVIRHLDQHLRTSNKMTAYDLPSHQLLPPLTSTGGVTVAIDFFGHMSHTSNTFETPGSIGSAPRSAEKIVLTEMTYFNTVKKTVVLPSAVGATAV
jgi:hypothetical protein